MRTYRASFVTLLAVSAITVSPAGVLAFEPGASWAPVPGKLMTEWGAKVTPDNVWPEYPRPSLERSEWMNLNGLWDYAILGMDPASTDKVQGKILVPFPPESALSGVGKIVQPDQTLHYRRTFEVPASWKGRRTILNLDRKSVV